MQFFTYFSLQIQKNTKKNCRIKMKYLSLQAKYVYYKITKVKLRISYYRKFPFLNTAVLKTFNRIE